MTCEEAERTEDREGGMKRENQHGVCIWKARSAAIRKACPPPSPDSARPSPPAHLTTSPVDGLRCDCRIQDLELDIADGLIAQRPLTHSPLEALHHLQVSVQGSETVSGLECEQTEVSDQDAGSSHSGPSCTAHWKPCTT